MKVLLMAASLFLLYSVDVRAGEPFRYSYRYGQPQSSRGDHTRGFRTWSYSGPGGYWSGNSNRVGNTTFHYGYGPSGGFNGTTFDYGYGNSHTQLWGW